MIGYILIGCLVLLIILLIKQRKNKDIIVYNVYADNDDDNQPMTQDKNGNWIPATFESLGCEIDNCPETEGDWYVRNAENKDGSDWDIEPVYLCKKHGEGHELFKEI